MTFDGTKYIGCVDEQQFKMAFIKEVLKKENKNVFCIETEETVKGFPDVLDINDKTGVTTLYEFKVARQGKIKFQPSQPAFYLQHKELNTKVVALDLKKHIVVMFNVCNLFDEYSPYQMDEKGEVLI